MLQSISLCCETIQRRYRGLIVASLMDKECTCIEEDQNSGLSSSHDRPSPISETYHLGSTFPVVQGCEEIEERLAIRVTKAN